MQNQNIGIIGLGTYLPKPKISAAEIAQATNGVWTQQAVKEKLGIIEKHLPGPDDGTQEMGVKAALKAIENAAISSLEIDVVISIGEEWKEYPLTTSAIYIQEKVGAKNAWGIDFQQRCATGISAMKIAKDMMIADQDINTVLIAGGYRNSDFLDYTDKSMSMMYNLSAAGGAVILRKGFDKNLVLGSHIMSDGTMARDAGAVYGGTVNPITPENYQKAYKSLTLMNEKHMKDRLNQVSMDNWLHCIDRAFEKSGLEKRKMDYLAILHIKRSMHHYMLDVLNLTPQQSFYLENIGHAGQIDQIISIEHGLIEGKIKQGSIVTQIAAGIGYAWAANVIRWG